MNYYSFFITLRSTSHELSMAGNDWNRSVFVKRVIKNRQRRTSRAQFRNHRQHNQRTVKKHYGLYCNFWTLIFRLLTSFYEYFQLLVLFQRMMMMEMITPWIKFIKKKLSSKKIFITESILSGVTPGDQECWKWNKVHIISSIWSRNDEVYDSANPAR